MDNLDELYNDLIMEHSMNSYNKKILKKQIIAEWDTILTAVTK